MAEMPGDGGAAERHGEGCLNGALEDGASMNGSCRRRRCRPATKQLYERGVARVVSTRHGPITSAGRLNNAPLLLLSSNVQEDNAVLRVDLVNPGVTSRGLRGELIHVNRLKFIWNAACYERILVRNFDVQPHDLNLAIQFAGDFADLFEVRGYSRARRGQVSAERRSDSSVTLRYLGLDGVERITSLDFEPTPTRLDSAAATDPQAGAALRERLSPAVPPAER